MQEESFWSAQNSGGNLANTMTMGRCQMLAQNKPLAVPLWPSAFQNCQAFSAIQPLTALFLFRVDPIKGNTEVFAHKSSSKQGYDSCPIYKELKGSTIGQMREMWNMFLLGSNAHPKVISLRFVFDEHMVSGLFHKLWDCS